MNIRSFLACTVFAITGVAYSQDAPTVKVKVNDTKSTPTQTPQFQISNVPAKPYRPRNWLELDTTFEVDKAAKAMDTGPYVDQLEFKYYVALNKVTKGGKYILLTATIIYVNIPTKDKVHAMAFVSPASLTRLLEKNDFTTADIKAVGVEVNYGGQLVGGKSSTGPKFWEKLDGFEVMDGMIMPKAKTPFAPVWGDYDVDVKIQ